MKGNFNEELLIGIAQEVALSINHVPGRVLAVLVQAVQLLLLNVLGQIGLSTSERNRETEKRKQLKEMKKKALNAEAEKSLHGLQRWSGLSLERSSGPQHHLRQHPDVA